MRKSSASARPTHFLSSLPQDSRFSPGLLHTSVLETTLPPQATQTSTSVREDLHIKTFAEALAHLNKLVWRSFSRNHGVPTTNKERFPYVLKLRDAIWNVQELFDDDFFPMDGRGTDPMNGMWKYEEDVETVAHLIADRCVHLHVRGASGLAFARNSGLPAAKNMEYFYTYAWRIYFICHLLRHFKMPIHFVMQTPNMIDQYLVRIWSRLAEQLQFTAWWDKLSVEDKARQ